jgi:hypothetical protein
MISLFAMLIWLKGVDKPAVLTGVSTMVFGTCLELGMGEKYGPGECVSFVVSEIVYIIQVEKVDMVKFVSEGEVL